ncbi:MAG: asparagine synthase-related protein [Candidatus Helarchaeota archaeon]
MNEYISELSSKLSILLEKSIKNTLSDGILLSGGLDTSIVASIAVKYTKIKAVTIAFENAPTPDVEYAKRIANYLKIEHVIHKFNQAKLFSALEKTIEIMSVFDPMEIRNSASIYIGLKKAKEYGISSVLTGDGADELFGGYSFLFNKTDKELDLELKKIAEVMSFSSIPLAKSLGMETKLPYLEPEFVEFALSIPSKYKIMKSEDKIWGKWILRKAFEAELPKEIIWREKTPIEVGSGTTILPDLFNKKIPDEEFKEKKQKILDNDNVTIRDKEHLYYYEIYRKLFGVPKTIDPSMKVCPYCNSNVHNGATFCKICGAYPI